MFNLRVRMRVIAYAMAISAQFLTPEAAIGMTLDCGARGSSFRILNAVDDTVTFNLDAKDFVQWQVVQGAGTVTLDYGSGPVTVATPGSYTAAVNVTRATLRITGTNAQTAVSCTPDGGKSVDLLALYIGAVSQTNATNIGVGLNSKNRFLDATGNIISKNKIYVSTSNMGGSRFLPPDWNAWMTLEGRSYSGGINGVTYDLVGGVDRLVSQDLLIGVLGGFGRTFLNDTGTAETSTSPMLGAYFGGRLQEGLIIDGFISVARPSYAISGASFGTSRYSAGLTLTGRVQSSAVTWEPFVAARGFSENQPSYTTGGGGIVAANQTSTISASLGLRVKFEGSDQSSNFVPYVSAAADFKRATSTLSGTDILQAPRLAMGIQGALGNGTLRVDVDFGKVRSDTFDRGIKFGYELKF